MTFAEQARAEGVVRSFLVEVRLSDGRTAIWMGDHWMVTGCR